MTTLQRWSGMVCMVGLIAGPLAWAGIGRGEAMTECSHTCPSTERDCNGCSKEAAPGATPEATIANQPSGPAPTGGKGGTPQTTVKDVSIEGGTYTMGNSKDVITVASFYMDDIEVTVTAYKGCVTAGICSEPDSGALCNWKKLGRENHPINCVDWDQATRYCSWKEKRLPTEEEWEWAARGGSLAMTYPWGEGDPSDHLCWDGEGNNKGKGKRFELKLGTCAVGSHPRGTSPRDIKDLAGNVREWTSSKWGKQLRHRVSRGGGWIDFEPFGVRVDAEFGLAATSRNDDLGFRCVKNR